MPVSIFRSLDLVGQALSVQRTRLDTVSNNLANAQTTRAEGEAPYRRRDVIIRAPTARDDFGFLLREGSGPPVRAVEVADVVEDTAEPRLVYEPTHPHANEDGYVAYPNVNAVEEMVDMITTMRSYQANLSVLEATRDLAHRALAIGRSS